MSKWIIPAADSTGASNSIWFGLEAVVSCFAPAMSATTTALQLQASDDPMSVPDAAADFVDVTVGGTLVTFAVSATVKTADGLDTMARFNRLRVVAKVSAGGAAVEQAAARTITPHSIRT